MKGVRAPFSPLAAIVEVGEGVWCGLLSSTPLPESDPMTTAMEDGRWKMDFSMCVMDDNSANAGVALLCFPFRCCVGGYIPPSYRKDIRFYHRFLRQRSFAQPDAVVVIHQVT